MERESNYDVFKRDALKRFLTYEQDPVIDRLALSSDEQYIYIRFFSRDYRIGRTAPVMEWKSETDSPIWTEADCNEVLTICDLLCHTQEPLLLSGEYRTVESLNRVKGGSATMLGDGFFGRTERRFDHHLPALREACSKLGGVPMGKGDAAYRIPLFGPVGIQIQFYESDDEFPASLTLLYDADICSFLFYETIWYCAVLVLERIIEIMDEIESVEEEKENTEAGGRE